MKNLLLPFGVQPRRKSARLLFLVLMAWAVVLTQVPARAADAMGPPGTIPQPKVPLQMLSGTVTDENGAGLPGVSILIKGTQRGTTTDTKGQYQLDLPGGSVTLVFSFVGYISQEKVVPSSQSTLNVSLAPDTQTLDEMIVVGYGTVKKSDLTGSVASIKVGEVQQSPISAIDQGLAGRAPGVQVTQTSGMPGAIASIRIRGSSSLQGGNEPLYVIDGVPVYSGGGFGDTGGNGRISPLSTINPADIESMEILKDASSTAIYGARAANGVVLITTKTGKAGRDAISLDSYYGIQNVARKIPVLNGTQYATLVNEAYTNDGLKAPYDASFIANIPNNGKGTDWQDEIFRSAPMQNHQLSFSGGDTKTTYALSLNYLDQQGIILGSNFNRLGGRINLSRQVNKRFKVGSHLNVSRTNAKSVETDAGGQGGVVTGALKFNPALPIYEDEEKGLYTQVNTPGSLYPNPVATARELKITNKTTRMLGDVSGELEIIPGLKAKVMFGLDYFATKAQNYVPSTIYQSAGQAVASISDATYTNWLNENTLSYSRTFHADHTINAVGGVTFQQNVSENLSAGSQGFVNNVLQDYDLGTGAIYSKPASGLTQWSMMSFLGRVNYNYKSKYLLTVSGRYDGSSRFGENNKFAFFPSAALAWRAIDEDFIANLSVFSDLKFRLSYGVTGNQEIGLYSSLPTLASGNYTIGRSIKSAFYPVGIPNPDLKWERTNQFDAGVDFGFLDNKINITADYYIKNTNDLIYSISIPSVSGFNTSLQNIGSVQNRGFEFSLESRNVNREFKWTTSFNISFNQNKVLDLGGEQYKEVGSGDGHLKTGAIHRLIVGEPIGVFYGYQFDGIYQNQAEVDQGPKGTTTYVGGKRYKDISGPNGTPDGVVDATYDRAIIGNPYPRGFGGLTNTFSYKGLELVVFNQFSYGNTIFNLNAIELGLPSGGQNVSAELLDRWTPTNPSNTWSKATTNRAAVVSDQFMEDGSFLKFKTVTLSYRFSKVPALKNLQIYATGQNLLTFTKYTGYDPEVSYRGVTNLEVGEDYGGYPQSRTFLLGIRIGI
jgi:TonB-dependent starch-binding outer membrane protein SusC